MECKCPGFGGNPHVSDDVMAEALVKIYKESPENSQMRLVMMGQVIDNWEEFRKGFNEELEHGCRSPEVNLTCDDPVATARIVLSHLKEEPNYYTKHGLG